MRGAQHFFAGVFADWACLDSFLLWSKVAGCAEDLFSSLFALIRRMADYFTSLALQGRFLVRVAELDWCSYWEILNMVRLGRFDFFLFVVDNFQ